MRSPSAESPASQVPGADIATQTGPYTDGVSNHVSDTREASGSSGWSAGVWVNGFSWYWETMRPYIVYDHTSFDCVGGMTTAITSSTPLRTRITRRSSTPGARPAHTTVAKPPKATLSSTMFGASDPCVPH